MSILRAVYISRRPALAFIVVGVFWGCFAAHVPDLKAQLGVSDATFGLLLLGSATGLVSAMFLAPRADEWLGQRSLQLGLLALSIAWLLPAHVSTPLIFAGAMALVGTASGMLDIVMNTRVSELEAAHHLPLMNANHAMFSIAYAVSALAAGAARATGVPPAIVFSALCLLAIATVPFAKTSQPTGRYPEQGQTQLPFWPILLCGAITLIAFMSEATVETWSALHIERTLNGGAAEGAIGPAMLGLTMAIGRLSGQAISEKFTETSIVTVAAFLSASGAVIAAGAPTPALAYLGFGLLGLGVSVIGPIGLALTGKLVPDHLRTRAISKVAVIGFSGFFLAPVLMGQVSDIYGLRITFACIGVLLCCAPAIALAINLPAK